MSSFISLIKFDFCERDLYNTIFRNKKLLILEWIQLALSLMLGSPMVILFLCLFIKLTWLLLNTTCLLKTCKPYFLYVCLHIYLYSLWDTATVFDKNTPIEHDLCTFDGGKRLPGIFEISCLTGKWLIFLNGYFKISILISWCFYYLSLMVYLLFMFLLKMAWPILLLDQSFSISDIYVLTCIRVSLKNILCPFDFYFWLSCLLPSI